MQLVEYKKFMPPPAVWILILVVAGWAIKTYVPPEYADTATMAWGMVLLIASGLGVNLQKLYDVAGSIGAPLPPGPKEPVALGMEAPEGTAAVRPAANQKRLARWLV